MFASFMVDPLGLELIDRIGVERAMWSTDFPHNESTYGYSGESLAAVVERGRARRRAAIVGGNVADASSGWTADGRRLMAAPPPARSPTSPDLARMHRDRVAGSAR